MTPERQAELDRLLVELRSMRLQPSDWEAVDRHLAAIDAGDGDAVDALSRHVFEARVRGRYSGPRRGGDVVATKQTSVLPAVGVVCGGLLVAVGALLGGGLILVAVVGLGLFVFGVAFAGSRVAHRRPAASEEATAGERPVPIPDAVALRVNALGRRA